MEAEKKITQARVAVKRVKLPTNKEENEKTLREVQLLAKLGTNPYIVGFNHTWTEEPPIGRKESLRDWLDKNSNRREDVIVPFFIQMLQGVAYIHEKGVIHRDLKPSNILFAIEGDGK